MFSQKKLKLMAQLCADKVQNAEHGVSYFEEPYKHLVVDGFFDQIKLQILR